MSHAQWTTLGTLPTLLHLLNITTPGDMYYYYLFVDDKIEALLTNLKIC